MSKAKLKEETVDKMRSELSSSLFFQPRQEGSATPPSEDQNPVQAQANPTQKQRSSRQEAKPPRNRDTAVSRHHDTTVPANQAGDLETIRQAVRQVGKEAATYRFTQQEKVALSQIVYSYKGRGVRTSENEITRIAVNHLVADYNQNGQESILAKVLQKLNQ